MSRSHPDRELFRHPESVSRSRMTSVGRERRGPRAQPRPSFQVPSDIETGPGRPDVVMPSRPPSVSHHVPEEPGADGHGTRGRSRHSRDQRPHPTEHRRPPSPEQRHHHAPYSHLDDSRSGSYRGVEDHADYPGHYPTPQVAAPFQRPFGVEPAFVAVNPFATHVKQTQPEVIIVMPPQPSLASGSSHSRSSATVTARTYAHAYPFTSTSPSPIILPSISQASPSFTVPTHTHNAHHAQSGHRRRQSSHRRPPQHQRRKSLRNLVVLVPQQIYLLLLLRLPSLYFSRVSRVFEDANLSLPDIQRMAVAHADQWKGNPVGGLLPTWHPSGLDAIASPHLVNFRHSWEGFVDSLLKEWKTQNVVSALMLSAILTMLQIDAAASDPIARTTALISLVCALMSLLFGSIYIIRFGTMRKMYKAASWADEAQKGRASILWNVWILLAMPSVWLAWSIVLFVTCIMAFAWQTGATDDPESTPLTPLVARWMRIGISAVLVLGLIYLLLIVETFRKYGDVMDQRWKEKVMLWAQQDLYASPAMVHGYDRPPSHLWTHRHDPPPIMVLSGSLQSSSSVPPSKRSYSISQRFGVPHVPVAPQTHIPASFNRPWVFNPQRKPPSLELALKVIGTGPDSLQLYPFPPGSSLPSRDVGETDWLQFTTDLRESWEKTGRDATGTTSDPEFMVSRLESIASLIYEWNTRFFIQRSTEAVLLLEQLSPGPNSGGPNFHVYLLERASSGQLVPLPVVSSPRKSYTMVRIHEETNHQLRHMIKVALGLGTSVGV